LLLLPLLLSEGLLFGPWSLTCRWWFCFVVGDSPSEGDECSSVSRNKSTRALELSDLERFLYDFFTVVTSHDTLFSMMVKGISFAGSLEASDSSCLSLARASCRSKWAISTLMRSLSAQDFSKLLFDWACIFLSSSRSSSVVCCFNWAKRKSSSSPCSSSP